MWQHTLECHIYPTPGFSGIILYSYIKDWARPARSPVRGPGLGPLRLRGPIQRMLKQNEPKIPKGLVLKGPKSKSQKNKTAHSEQGARQEWHDEHGKQNQDSETG